MKKKLAVLMALTMAIGTLAACGGTDKSGSSVPASGSGEAESSADTQTGGSSETENSGTEDVVYDPITIEFWNSWTGADGDILVEKVNEFNESNPWNITINMDISSQFSERLATTLPTGDCAPLILMGNADRFRYAEYLLPLDDIWENTTLSEADFTSNAMEVCKTDGVLYAIPFQNSLYYLYWNKDLFEKAGLDPETPPQSFEEWAEFASKITDPDNNVYGSGLFMSYGNQQMCLLGIDGGWAVSKADAGKWSVNIAGNENYKEYLTWMKSVYDNGDNPVENEIDSMFQAGQIGIMVNGPWLIVGAENAGINFGISKIFGNEPVGDVAGFFITSGASAEEKIACERFMQWWYTGNEGTAMEDTGAGVWSFELGYPTVYIPLAESEAYTSNERVSALTPDSDSKESLWITTDPDFLGWAETIGIMGAMTEAVVYDTPIEDAMATAQADAEALVVTYGGEDALAR